MFNWSRKTQTSQIINEIDAIFQPGVDDARAWKRIKDVGRFSLKIMDQFKGAWATVSNEHRRELKKALVILQPMVSPKTLMRVIEVYLKSVGVSNERKNV